MIVDARHGNEAAQRAIAKAPKMEPRWRYYWTAFQELGTERQQGMSAGPIPNSAIKAWCDSEELDPLEAEAFHYVIRTVDNHMRAKAAEQAEREAEKAKKQR